MPRENPNQFKISAANPELFTLQKVAQAPRSLSPLDLTSAGENLVIEFANPENHHKEVDSFLRYLFLEFFVSAHSTGLYNRQQNLWESIAKVSAGNFSQLTKGIFSKKELPVYEIRLNNSLDKTLIVAWFVDEIEDEQPVKELLQYLNDLIKKINKIRLGENVLTGAFLAVESPVDEEFVDKIKKLTGGDDPVARYDSRLPEPASIPLNLVEWSEEPEVDVLKFKLVHPHIPQRSKLKK